MTFGEQLRALREKAGLTQAALAELSGVGLGTIRDYEQELREPLLSTLRKLTIALKVSCRVFFVDDSDTRSMKKKPAPKRRPGRPKKGGAK